MSDNPQKFKLTRKTVPVTIEDADGTDRNYTVQELTGKDRDLFMKKLGDKARLNDKGEPIGFKDQVGLISHLLSVSLVDENGKKVSQETIDGWPSGTLDGLAKISYELSAIAPTEAAKVGND